MPSKGVNELNQAEREKQIEEKLKTQVNGIKALIEQNIENHIPHNKKDEIDILGIEYDDYIPLGKVDYKGLSCVVHYAKKTYDEQGNAEIKQEHVAFELNELGEIAGTLAEIDQNGKINITKDFEKKLDGAKNAELVKDINEDKYLINKDGKLQAVNEEEKNKMLNEEEAEKTEIAQNYRKFYKGNEKQPEKQDAEKDDILSITEIDDPTVLAKVLEVPMDKVSGKYKIVRFHNDKFVLVDDKNQIKAGLEISDLAKDIHNELNIRPEDKDTRIKSRELDMASSVSGRYNLVRINNPSVENDTEIVLSYSTTADSEVNIFERDGKGNLMQIDTKQKFPTKIVENGKENGVLPQNVTDLSKLKERQRKLQEALELEKTIQAYENKSHVVETLSGVTAGMLKGAVVGSITIGKPEVGATIGGIEGGISSYKASKADAEETIQICSEKRDDLLKELDIAKMKDAEQELEDTGRYLGDNLGRYGY